MVFFERAGLAIDIPDSLEKLRRESVGSHFDHEKVQALSAALLLLRSRRTSIRVAIIATEVPPFLDRINSAIRAVFADAHSLSINSVAEFLETAQEEVDLLIVLVNDEPARLAIGDRVAHHLSHESFILFDAMFELNRHDSTVSEEMQLRQLQRHGFIVVCESYFALLSRGYGYFGSDLDGQGPLDSEVQNQSLFILGCERSGTSLAVQLLNSRSDVFLTYEANWYRPKHRISPVGTFNRKGAHSSKPLDKGSYLPEWSSADLTLERLFQELQKFYTLVGDKMAFGPREASYERPVSELMRLFLEKYFPFSRILLTSRDPIVNCYASHRLRPDTKLIYILDNWLAGILQILHILMTNDRSALLTHDRLCRKSVFPLQQLTGMDFGAAIELIDWKEVTSRLPQAEAYFAGADRLCVETVREAAGIYENLLAAVPETGRPSTKDQREAVQSCYTQFKDLYQRLKDRGEW